MAGTFGKTLAALAVIFGVVSSASAFNGRFGLWPSSGSSGSARMSYYAAPAVEYYYYCPPVATVIPVPDARPTWAVPTPAPPSRLEPPLGSNDPRLPKITTTRSLTAQSASTGSRCRVGFWNLTGRDVSVTIEGRAWSLARNQVLTFDVERQFTWQVAGKSERVERVAEGQSSYEVIIRE